MRSFLRLLLPAIVAGACLWPVADASAKGKPRKREPPAGPVPAMLRGSKEARAAENRMIDRFGLQRYRHAADIRVAIDAKHLVRIAPSASYMLDETIGEMDKPNRDIYVHARPQVPIFLMKLAQHKDRPAGTVLKLTSFVRSNAYQCILAGAYANAAPCKEDKLPSAHLSGAAVDISTKGMTVAVKRWLRAVLIEYERNGIILATEETGRGGGKKRVGSQCFHVVVSPVLGAKRLPAPR